MNEKKTAKDVALFMKEQLDKKKDLYQEDVVYEIEKKFGESFIYINDNGNPAIDRTVLKEFRKITPNAVWVRGERYWRLRDNSDDTGSRMQDY